MSVGPNTTSLRYCSSGPYNWPLHTHSEALEKGLVTATIIIAVTSVILNAVIIVAVKRSALLRRSPSFLLLRALAMSDIFGGVAYKPIFIAFVLTSHEGSWEINCIFGTAGTACGMFLSGVTQGLIMSISLDRFLALFMGKRYTNLLNTKKVWLYQFVNVLLNTSLIGFWFWYPTAMMGFIMTMYTVYFLSGLGLYLAITVFLKRNKKRARNFHQKAESPFVLKYKKSLSIIKYIVLSLVISNLPLTVGFAVFALYGFQKNVLFLLEVFHTFSFTYTVLNPVLAITKLSQLRCAVKAVFHHYSSSSFRSSGTQQNVVVPL